MTTMNFRKEIKNFMLSAHGNRCACCGLLYNGSNEFLFHMHHKISTGASARGESPAIYLHKSMTLEDLCDYVTKLVPLCANCHAGVHNGGYTYTTLDPKVVRFIFAALARDYKENARRIMLSKLKQNGNDTFHFQYMEELV